MAEETKKRKTYWQGSYSFKQRFVVNSCFVDGEAGSPNCYWETQVVRNGEVVVVVRDPSKNESLRLATHWYRCHWFGDFELQEA